MTYLLLQWRSNEPHPSPRLKQCRKLALCCLFPTSLYKCAKIQIPVTRLKKGGQCANIKFPVNIWSTWYSLNYNSPIVTWNQLYDVATVCVCEGWMCVGLPCREGGKVGLVMSLRRPLLRGFPPALRVPIQVPRDEDEGRGLFFVYFIYPLIAIGLQNIAAGRSCNLENWYNCTPQVVVPYWSQNKNYLCPYSTLTHAKPITTNCCNKFSIW